VQGKKRARTVSVCVNVREARDFDCANASFKASSTVHACMHGVRACVRSGTGHACGLVLDMRAVWYWTYLRSGTGHTPKCGDQVNEVRHVTHPARADNSMATIAPTIPVGVATS
jgi:hypothetical protein